MRKNYFTKNEWGVEGGGKYEKLYQTLGRCSNDLRERNNLSTRHQLLCPADQEM